MRRGVSDWICRRTAILSRRLLSTRSWGIMRWSTLGRGAIPCPGHRCPDCLIELCCRWGRGDDFKRVEPIEYLGLEVEIGQGRDGEYPVRVISVAGQAQATMRPPFDLQNLDSELQALRAAMDPAEGGRRRKESAQQQAQAFGQALFDALFRNQIRVLYNSIRHQAAEEKRLFRLELRIEPQELAVLPWETLYDKQLGEYICEAASLLRHVEDPEGDWTSIATPPLRILGMVVHPGDGPPLGAEAEKVHLEEATSRLRALELVELEWVEGQSARDLVQALSRKEWHVFHFIGDGGLERDTGEGFVVVDDDAGQSRRLTASQLKWLLSKCKSLQMIWLSASSGALGDRPDRFAATADLLVQKGVPAVLSAQLGTNSPAAEAFIEAFYAALAATMPLDLAALKGRMAVQMNGTAPVWGAPVLHTRLPDLRFFERQSIRAAAQRRGEEALSGDDFERALTQYALAVEMGAEPGVQEQRELAESAVQAIEAAEKTLDTPAADVEAQTESVVEATSDLERLQEQLPASMVIPALLGRLREQVPGLRGRLWQKGQELLELKTVGLTLEQRYRRMEDSVRLLEKAKSLTRGENPPLEADLGKARRRLDYLQSAQERAQADRGRRVLRNVIIIALVISALVALYFLIRLLPLSELFGGDPTAAPAVPTQAATVTPTETIAATMAVATSSPTALEEAGAGSEVSPTAVSTATASRTSSPQPTSSDTATWTPLPEATATDIPTATPQPSDTVAPVTVQVEPTSTLTATATATPTPGIIYGAPVLVEPDNDVFLSQDGGSEYALRWAWDGSLQEGEWFDVRIWEPGMPHLGVAWTKEPAFQFDICSLVSGEYFWSVAVVRGEDSAWLWDLSPEAAQRQFTIARDDLWCKLRGY